MGNNASNTNHSSLDFNSHYCGLLGDRISVQGYLSHSHDPSVFQESFGITSCPFIWKTSRASFPGGTAITYLNLFLSVVGI